MELKKLLVFFSIIFFVSCSSSSSNSIEALSEKRSMAIEAFDKINAHRKSIGKKALIWDEEIYKLSLEHSINMDKGNVAFGHDGFDNRSSKLFALGYNSTGENVHYSMGYSDPVSIAVTGWLNSPGHKANIEGNFDRSAVGVSSMDGKTYYFTQIFGYKGD